MVERFTVKECEHHVAGRRIRRQALSHLKQDRAIGRIAGAGGQLRDLRVGIERCAQHNRLTPALVPAAGPPDHAEHVASPQRIPFAGRGHSNIPGSPGERQRLGHIGRDIEAREIGGDIHMKVWQRIAAGRGPAAQRLRELLAAPRLPRSRIRASAA